LAIETENLVVPHHFMGQIILRDPTAIEDSPDWRNKSHYDFIVGKDNSVDDNKRSRRKKTFMARYDELAWQFLRRNNAYIDAWNHQQSLLVKDLNKATDFAREKAALFHLDDKHPLYDPRLYLPAPLFSVNNVPCGRLLRTNLGEGFGPERKPITDDSSDPAVDLRLYLGAPYDEQVKKLKNLFTYYQNKLPSGYANPKAKPHRYNLVEYCRILDALKEGVAPKEIADTLWSNNENRHEKFYQKKASAEKLVNFGYIKIIGFI